MAYKKTHIKHFHNPNQNIVEMFENMKAGDEIAFETRKWYHIFGKTIQLITKSPFTHIGVVIFVDRKDKQVFFDFAEAKIKNGVIITSKKITKYNDKNYVLEGFPKKQKIYWVPSDHIADVRNSIAHGTNPIEEQIYIKQTAEFYLGAKYNKFILIKTGFKRIAGYLVKSILSLFGAKKQGVILFEPKSMQEAKKEGFVCSSFTRRVEFDTHQITEEEFYKNPYPNPKNALKGKKVLLLANESY